MTTESTTTPTYTATVNDIGEQLNTLGESIHGSIAQINESRENMLAAFDVLRANLNREIDVAIRTVHDKHDELAARMARLIA